MAQLDLVVSTAVGPYDLAALGTLDWFLFPASTTAVKKSGTTYLSTGHVGPSFTDGTYGNGIQLTWTGGAPTASGSSTGGIFTTNGTVQMAGGAGYSVTAPADTTVRTLRLVAGCYSCAMKIRATLSDGSSPEKIDNTSISVPAQNTGKTGYIEITYAAASAGQKLTVEMTIDAPSFSNRNVAIQGAALSGAAPAGGGITVTGVTITPATATVNGGATQQFNWAVTGNNSPSQAVKLAASAGTIDAAGLFKAPAATPNEQIITVTATSEQDSTKKGTATVTVPAATLAIRTVTVALDIAKDVPAANLTGASIAFYDEQKPGQYGTVRYQSNTETFDASGVMTFTCQTALAAGAQGGVSILFDDGKHYTGKATVS